MTLFHYLFSNLSIPILVSLLHWIILFIRSLLEVRDVLIPHPLLFYLSQYFLNTYLLNTQCQSTQLSLYHWNGASAGPRFGAWLGNWQISELACFSIDLRAEWRCTWLCFKTGFTFENKGLYMTDPDWGQHWHRVSRKGMFSVHSPLETVGFFKPFCGECGAFMIYVACMMHPLEWVQVFL